MYQDKEIIEYPITLLVKEYRHMFSIMESNIFQHLGSSMLISLTASHTLSTISILSIHRFIIIVEDIIKTNQQTWTFFLNIPCSNWMFHKIIWVTQLDHYKHVHRRVSERMFARMLASTKAPFNLPTEHDKYMFKLSRRNFIIFELISNLETGIASSWPTLSDNKFWHSGQNRAGQGLCLLPSFMSEQRTL